MQLIATVLALVCLQNDGAESFLGFKVGTRWIYRSQTPDNRELRTETSVVESKPGTMTVESVHSDGGRTLGKKTQIWRDRDGSVWLDVVALYRPGTKKGDQWRYRVLQDEFVAVNQGVESITVPAGSFDNAIRIHHSGGGFEADWWVVPGTGMVKSVTTIPNKGTITIELKEFSGGGAIASPSPPAKKDPPPPIPDADLDALFVKAKLQVAEAHLRAGRKDKAIEVLEDLIKSYPKSPLIPDAKRLLEEARKK